MTRHCEHSQASPGAQHPLHTKSCGMQDARQDKPSKRLYMSDSKIGNLLADIGQLRNDCQMDLSLKEQTVGRSTLAMWTSSTLLLLENITGLSLPNSCVMNAGFWTWKSHSTCQLVRAVQSFVKYQLSQVVSLRDMLSDLETCLTQDYCQDARDKIACKLSHLFSRMSMSRLSDFETGLRQCGKTSRDLALGLS